MTSYATQHNCWMKSVKLVGSSILSVNNVQLSLFITGLQPLDNGLKIMCNNLIFLSYLTVHSYTVLAVSTTFLAWHSILFGIHCTSCCRQLSSKLVTGLANMFGERSLSSSSNTISVSLSLNLTWFSPIFCSQNPGGCWALGILKV